MGLLTFNALLAAGEILIPVDPSYYSLQAVRKMRETLTLLREKKGHDLVPHILMSDFDTRPRFVRSIMAELDELITEIRDEGISILLIEHDMKLVMSLSDHIFVMDYGRKIAEGSPEEVRNNPEVIKAYLGEDAESMFEETTH